MTLLKVNEKSQVVDISSSNAVVGGLFYTADECVKFKVNPLRVDLTEVEELQVSKILEVWNGKTN